MGFGVKGLGFLVGFRRFFGAYSAKEQGRFIRLKFPLRLIFMGLNTIFSKYNRTFALRLRENIATKALYRQRSNKPANPLACA